MPKVKLMSRFSIKCFLGFHDWDTEYWGILNQNERNVCGRCAKVETFIGSPMNPGLPLIRVSDREYRIYMEREANERV